MGSREERAETELLPLAMKVGLVNRRVVKRWYLMVKTKVNSEIGRQEVMMELQLS